MSRSVIVFPRLLIFPLMFMFAGAVFAEHIIPPPATPLFNVSTIPPSGDVNPYGVAYVPGGFPSDSPLAPGDILVSNFNDSSGVQGTGSTIVQITKSGGGPNLFFQGAPDLGLTTALGVLRAGFVLVGAVPTTDGACDTIQPGGLLIIDRQGNLVATLTSNTLLDGPWDLTVVDMGSRALVFVSNVLSGTVTRINLSLQGGSPTVTSETQIASGYTTACNTAAVVVGPTGVAYDRNSGILYVASTADNEIFAVGNAAFRTKDSGPGRVIYNDPVHLHGPLALALAPNGHLITANGDAVFADPSQLSEIVEFTEGGRFVGQFQIDTAVGSAFGLAVTQVGETVLFAAVDDNTNSLEEWVEHPQDDDQQ